MSYYNSNDIRLSDKLEEVKECLEETLDLISICDADTQSEINTQYLKKSITRFLEDIS